METVFDKIVDRSGTHSQKWNRAVLEESFGNADAIPMWVADMDFQAPPPIVEAVTARAAHGIYGYSYRDDAYYDAIIGWQRRRHNWDIRRDWIFFTPGVVPAFTYALLAYTQPGDKILIQEPVYYPFRDSIQRVGREVVVSPLILEDGHYRMDLEDLAEKAADPAVKMLIFCSPHNPVGRVWSPEELLALGKVCTENDLLILADEIHNDWIMPGHSHTVLASLSPDIAARTITCFAPSKTFNVAGLQSSSMVISNVALRERMEKILNELHISGQNPFGIVATIAACNQCEGWLEEVIAYVAGNYELLARELRRRLPGVVVSPLEGTYLAWVDFSAYLSGEEPPEKEVGRKAGVALDPGIWFGESGAGYLRFNLACPRSTVEEAARRLGDAFGKAAPVAAQ